MSFDTALQFLNLPILGGIIILIFKAGRLAQKIDDHGRRIGDLERSATWHRRQGELAEF